LSSLTKLEQLRSRENPLTNQTCPVTPESVCSF
jgi:hypothetical protein